MLDTGIGPMHYGVSEDQEIDTAWQTTTGAFDYEMTTNDWQTYARDTFDAGDIFRFEKDGEWVEFDPQSLDWIDENNSQQQIAITQAVSAVVNDDIINFPAGFGPGRHFQYQNQTARLQKLITIDADTDLPAVTLQGSTIHLAANFTIAHSTGVEVYVDGVLWEKANNVRVRTADRIEFRDAATGQNVFWYLDFPRAWDSSAEIPDTEPNDVVGQMEVRRQGGPSSLFITVRIPKTWIDTAVFPVMVDPSLDYQVGADSDDAWEGAGTVWLTGGNSEVIVDATNEYYGQRWTGVTIPDGATIDTAHIDIYLPSGPNDEPQHTVYFEDGSSPGTFTTGSSDISNRTSTTATATLGDGSGKGAPDWWSNLVTQPDPEIKTIIQELVDSYDYSSGAAMVCVIQGSADGSDDLVRRDYSSSTTEAAKLHIEYTADGDPAPNVSDDATATDSVTVDVSDPQASVSDDAEATDTATADIQVDASVSDDATATDTATAALASNVAEQDAATATDTTAVTVSAPDASVQDDATATDTTALSITVEITAQDDATATDSVTVAIVSVSDLTVSVQDDATASDSVTIVLPIGILVQDDATATDTSTLDIALAIAAQDDATASDSVTAAIETPATFLSVNISKSANYVQIV
jgi:hypothetical protein